MNTGLYGAVGFGLIVLLGLLARARSKKMAAVRRRRLVRNWSLLLDVTPGE